MLSKLKRALEKLWILQCNQKQWMAYLRKRGIIIGEDCDIFKDFDFNQEPYMIRIGNHVRISTNVHFITHDGSVWVLRTLKHEPRYDILKPISVGNNVHIGMGSYILSGVTIGDNVIIATGAVVTKDVPSGEIWGGVPAHYIERTEDYYQKHKDDILLTKGLNAQEKKEWLIKNVRGW